MSERSEIDREMRGLMGKLVNGRITPAEKSRFQLLSWLLSKSMARGLAHRRPHARIDRKRG